MFWIPLLALFGLGVLVAFILLGGCFMVSQGQAAVLERLGKFHRVVYSGIHFRIPLLETFRVVGFINREEYRKDFGPYRIDLREQIFDMCKQHVITHDNVPVDVDTIIYYRVTQPEQTVYGITDLPKALEQLALTHVRNEFGRMDLDVSLGSREQLNRSLQAGLHEATGKWGVQIQRVEVQEIIPPSDLKDPMEKQMIAERERRVQVLVAQAEKEAMILKAEGAKQQAILEAEAKKAEEVLAAEAQKQKTLLEAEAAREQQILVAQGRKEAQQLESEGEKIARLNWAEAESAAILKQLSAQAQGLAQISQALNAQDSNQALLALKSLEAAVQVAQNLGNGQATKLILPQEVSGLVGTLLSLAEGVRSFPAGK
jgi:regulator of protease activity HflC (stomatin/prohibitin superfamily)